MRAGRVVAFEAAVAGRIHQREHLPQPALDLRPQLLLIALDQHVQPILGLRRIRNAVRSPKPPACLLVVEQLSRVSLEPTQTALLVWKGSWIVGRF